MLPKPNRIGSWDNLQNFQHLPTVDRSFRHTDLRLCGNELHPCKTALCLQSKTCKAHVSFLKAIQFAVWWDAVGFIIAVVLQLFCRSFSSGRFRASLHGIHTRSYNWALILLVTVDCCGLYGLVRFGSLAFGDNCGT